METKDLSKSEESVQKTEKQMVGYIYLMTDTTNGMKYVGQHRYNKKELDPNYKGSGTLIKKAYDKRKDLITEEYIRTCYSQKQLDFYEAFFIRYFNTVFPDGYNLSEGNVRITQNEYTETLENGLKRAIKKLNEQKDYIGVLEESNKRQDESIIGLAKCIDDLEKELEKRGYKLCLGLGRHILNGYRKEE